MILPINFHKAALAEAQDAYHWYESKEYGLGDAFRKALDEVIDSVQAGPLGNQVIYGLDIRRAIMRRFSFLVICTVHDNSFLVLAVFHMSRDPRTWHRRS
jgi:plasmid stabilization system protein ParE